jgi:hypothetical protein
MQLRAQLKAIRRTRIQLKFDNLKLRTLNDVSFRLNEEKMNDTSFVSLHICFDGFSSSSWQLQTNKCGVIGLQIKQS